MHHSNRGSKALAIVGVLVLAGAVNAVPIGAPVDPANRRGQEVMICGQLYNAGTPVILWTDPGGYNLGQHIRPTTRPNDDGSPGYQVVRGGDIDFAQLQPNVDQFVIHFDECGTSKECFRVLNRRGLSVQFMCDLDGTVYQTMDLRDAAPHATIANSRSIGCETANVGTYAADKPAPKRITEWFKVVNGQTRITLPASFGDGGIHTPNFVGHPARPTPIEGNVQGMLLRQMDYTPQQYDALAHLGATLCTLFPKIQPDYPRQRTALGHPTTGPTTQPADCDPTTQPSALAEPGEPGELIPHALNRAQFDAFQGIIGHYQIQTDKDDPGPAFQWIPVLNRIRALMTPEALAASKAARHQPVPRGYTLMSERRSSGGDATSHPTTEPASQP